MIGSGTGEPFGCRLVCLWDLSTRRPNCAFRFASSCQLKENSWSEDGCDCSYSAPGGDTRILGTGNTGERAEGEIERADRFEENRELNLEDVFEKDDGRPWGNADIDFSEVDRDWIGVPDLDVVLRTIFYAFRCKTSGGHKTTVKGTKGTLLIELNMILMTAVLTWPKWRWGDSSWFFAR